MRGFAVAALAAGVLLAAPALAADFTLHVPVHIENLHSASRFYVNCYAMGPGTTVASYADMSGTPIVGGNYDGTVTVTMNAADVNAARTAVNYKCELSVYAMNPHTGTAVRTNVYSYSSPTAPNPGYVTSTGQTLASVQGVVMGSLH
jgi:hypothetical protein